LTLEVANSIDSGKQLKFFRSKLALLKVSEMPDFKAARIPIGNEEPNPADRQSSFKLSAATPSILSSSSQQAPTPKQIKPKEVEETEEEFTETVESAAAMSKETFIRLVDPVHQRLNLDINSIMTRVLEEGKLEEEELREVNPYLTLVPKHGSFGGG